MDHDNTNYSFINLPQSTIDYANNVGVWVPHSNDHYYDYGKGNTYGLSGMQRSKLAAFHI